MNKTNLIPATVLAACVLHNLCIDNRDLNIEEGKPYVHGNDQVEVNNINVENENLAPNNGEILRERLCL